MFGRDADRLIDPLQIGLDSKCEALTELVGLTILGGVGVFLEDPCDRLAGYLALVQYLERLESRCVAV